MRSALIVGVAGPVLAEAEAAFLRAARPAGLVLFARNCVAPDQVRQLIETAKAAIQSDALLVLIDQEGGRVRRLRPPQWRALPAAAAYGRLYELDPDGARRKAWLAARLTAHDLNALGVNANCAPVLDVPVAGAHDIIGDRAYGATPRQVSALGRAVAEGHLAGGVLPIVKHIPGHGRARCDSHVELPVVTASRAELEHTDFAPFRDLNHLPAAMSAHVVFAAIDSAAPASTSPLVIDQVIRGAIGFDGLLMSDDLGMTALSGTPAERAGAVLRAGSDLVLHCSGSIAEMEQVAGVVPPLVHRALARFDCCLDLLGTPEDFDAVEAEAAVAEVLAAAA